MKIPSFASCGWSWVLVLAWTSLYYVTSTGSIVWNKHLVDGGGVSATMLTLVQLVVSLLSDALILRYQHEGAPRPAPDLRRHSVLDVLVSFAPVSLFIVLCKISTYVSYQYVSVSLSHTAKASEPIFNVLLAASFFGEFHPRLVYLSLIPIALGVTLSSVTDFSYNHAGVLCSVASAASKVLQNIYTKRIMSTGRYSFWEIHLFCGAASLVILLPIMALEALTSTSGALSSFPILSLFGGSLLQYFSSVASYKVLQLVSHLSFTVISVLKRLVVIFGSSLLLAAQGAAPLQALNVFGVILAIAGILGYQVSKDLQPALAAGPTDLFSARAWAVWAASLLQGSLWQQGAQPLEDAADGDSAAAAGESDAASSIPLRGGAAAVLDAQSGAVAISILVPAELPGVELSDASPQTKPQRSGARFVTAALPSQVTSVAAGASLVRASEAAAAAAAASGAAADAAAAAAASAGFAASAQREALRAAAALATSGAALPPSTSGAPRGASAPQQLFPPLRSEGSGAAAPQAAASSAVGGAAAAAAPAAYSAPPRMAAFFAPYRPAGAGAGAAAAAAAGDALTAINAGWLAGGARSARLRSHMSGGLQGFSSPWAASGGAALASQSLPPPPQSAGESGSASESSGIAGEGAGALPVAPTSAREPSQSHGSALPVPGISSGGGGGGGHALPPGGEPGDSDSLAIASAEAHKAASGVIADADDGQPTLAVR